MFMHRFILAGSGLAALSLAACAVWLFLLPPAPPVVEAPPVAQSETDAMLASLRPRRARRPLIAIVGLNDATETTDFLMPAGILRRADIADVVMLAIAPGAVKLYPALSVEADATTAQFDERHPEGADYVIVPAMSRDDDPNVIGWLRSQAGKGAIVISVCAGAKVVGAAGLLDGKRATTHWYYLKDLLARNPSIRYAPDRRMVVDESVATTTGISASMPMMLTLIEAIAGREKAEATARDIGLSVWSARHASDAFKLTRRFATTVLGNALAFWRRERIGMELKPGVDEVALALVADAWSRTYRSRAVTFATQPEAVETRNGVRLIPDETAADRPEGQRVYAFAGQRPAEALDRALLAIATAYGERTAEVVAMQLEYPRPIEPAGGPRL